MSKILSTSAVIIASATAVLSLAMTGSTSGFALPSDEPPTPPPTTSAPNPDGNPWHD
ncbi:hypothetical protein P3102_29230 [Amycolatopsis sp. QT-25]|uniref:hypothetical protein n=1 Tax=Amycolatopsis sp. QT-25 TaxID=3034022 RepID=UPI0023EB08AB|nr:hypothetical protein [Amycolatopsis sp. QT-25]WET78117.1 hypothetical protein P3102_29230 [Amycolatopsis sp. QT-25]